MERVSRETAERAVARALSEHRQALDGVEAAAPDLARAAEMIATSFAEGGRLLVCGNGGSAADAQHIAAEFVGRFLTERRPYSAIALNANSSVLTALGNDYGFDRVFDRQVRAHGRAGDVLLAISTSGQSPNVLAAMDAARETGMAVVGLSGGEGGSMATRSDVCVTVSAASTPRVQEMHILLGHLLCGLVEDVLA